MCDDDEGRLRLRWMNRRPKEGVARQATNAKLTETQFGDGTDIINSNIQYENRTVIELQGGAHRLFVCVTFPTAVKRQFEL